jgi:hypothetical protein
MPIINQVVKGGGGSGPTGLYREFQLDANGKLIPNTTTTHIMDFTGMTDVDQYMLANAYCNNTAISGAVDMSDLIAISGTNACDGMFQGCTGITSVDLSSLTTVGGGGSPCNNMFNGCTGITSVDLSSLTSVNGQYGCRYMFQDCTGMTSVNLSSLTTVGGATACYYMFKGCTGLTSVNLSSLTTISGSCNSMFKDCSGITSVDMSGLTTISGNQACGSMFQGCTSLATVYIGGTTAIDFSTRTNQFVSMFDGCTQNIDVYAPAANQAKIESFSGYPNFGGTGTVTWHWRS